MPSLPWHSSSRRHRVSRWVCTDADWQCTSLRPPPINNSSLSLCRWHFIASTDAPEHSAAASEARHQHSASSPYEPNTGPKHHLRPGHGHSTSSHAHPAENPLWQGVRVVLFLHLLSTLWRHCITRLSLSHRNCWIVLTTTMNQTLERTQERMTLHHSPLCKP